jgi:enamine deaminase RidA (YjgF/YER057c/UK114 family)
VTTEGYRATADVRQAYFHNGFPAATGVVVQGLLRPDALIEIDAIAVLEDTQ